MNQKVRIINIITLGSSFVGKTSIINRIHFNKFEESLPATIGIKYNIIKRNYTKKNIIISLNFRDTMGHERYQSILPLQYIRDSHIVLLVFCNIDTLNEVKNRWYKLYKENANIDNSRFILVGNKSDIFGNEKELLKKYAKEFADEIDAHFIICSAKSADHIDNLESFILREAKSFIDEEEKQTKKDLESEAKSIQLSKKRKKHKCVCKK